VCVTITVFLLVVITKEVKLDFINLNTIIAMIVAYFVGMVYGTVMSGRKKSLLREFIISVVLLSLIVFGVFFIYASPS